MSAPLALDLETPVRDGFSTVATFIPKLIGFLVILLVGYFVAKIIAKLVDKGLEKAGFDRAVERGGIKKALAKSSYDASDIVAKLVFFAIFIPFLSAAVGTLGIRALEQPHGRLHRTHPADHRRDRARRRRRRDRRHRQGVHHQRPRRAVVRHRAGQRRQHPDPARLREVGARPGRHRHHGDRSAALHDPRHRRRRDHHRRRRRSHQADAEPLGEHAQPRRDRERQRPSTGPHHRRVGAADAYPSEPSYSSAPTGRTVSASGDAPTATYGTSTRQ